ncbi:alpha/beta hydrolase family protein [Zunongwangia sp. HGR-M22]|uniref:alpha/beta hydrolase family protein n=1 Tax=Zunongwangia sp. HGR-M22 TaxID=3015168 RepID=UPI0022DE3820|nr:prolyl oligopeptidase family serine peptidase [Zunongwangia sp. HGR-M22]WBL26575.1 prolyl oligopeptidase family serine peptidase [Zunongwangia sp. HGR-M22]
MLKVKQLVIFSIFCISAFGHSQQLWQGQYNSKRLLLEKVIISDGPDSIFLSSPEHMYKKLPLQQEKKGDSLFLMNQNYNIRLKIKTILGDLSQDSLVANYVDYTGIHPVNFIKTDSLQPLSFPQHPKGKLPYINKEVTFYSEKTDITYGGTLVLPKHTNHYPLVFLLNGSGQQDRNYTYAGHQFFTVLADALAKKGIASFRIDDRGIGETTGDFENATIEDFVLDLEAANSFIKSQENIDHSFMGIIGHSEGGVVASIAASRDKEFKFMLSLSGVGVTGLKILNLQNTAILKSMNIEDSLIDHYMELYNSLFKTVYNHHEADNLKLKLEQAVNNWMQDKDGDLLQSMGLADGREKNLIYRFHKEAKKDAYQYMIRYNPKEYLPKIEIPVMVLNGAKDVQVPAEENIAGFRKYLSKSTNFASKIYPNLNHMYQHCHSCTTSEQSELEEVFAPEVLADITKWIHSVDQTK